MITFVKYLDNNAGGGNGSNTALEDKLFGGFGGTPGKTEAELATEAAAKLEAEKNKGGTGGTDDSAKDQATLEGLLAKEEKDLTADEKKNLDALKLKYNIEELGEDGKPLTKEQKEAIQVLKTKLDGILAKPEDKRTEEENKFLSENTTQEQDIYSQVDELSGIPVEVDYGTIDPKTPEGIVKREDSIRRQAASEYDNNLKENFPIAYQLMLHQQAGGNIDDFFAQGNDQDYSEIILSKADAKGQESLYRKALALKGNTPEQVDALVQFAKDKQKLFEYSTVELTSLQAKQASDTKQREATIKQQEQQDTALVDSFYKAVNSSLISGIKGVNIPKIEHKAFNNYLQEGRFFIKDGKLLAITEITNNNLQEELAAAYFKFKKADLSAIAQRKAESINANNIRAKIKYKLTPKSTGGDNNKNYVPMSQI